MFSSLSQPHCPWRMRWCSIIALLILSAVSAYAQDPLPDTLVPRRPAYGFDIDEFEIGGVLATRPPPPQSFGAVWEFLRTIGVNVVEIRNPTWADLDALVTSADPARNERVMPNISPMNDAGYGREAVFYPFDSAQNYYYRNVFTVLNGGTTVQNATQRDETGHLFTERVYNADTNLQANQVVCSQIAFGYDSTKTHRHHNDVECDFTKEDISSFIYPQLSGREKGPFYIDVQGHLFQGGAANNGDSILTIEVWYEPSRGARWLDADCPRVVFYDSLWKHTAAEIAQLRASLAPDSVIVLDDILMASGLRGPFLDSITAAHTHTVTGDSALLTARVFVRKQDFLPTNNQPNAFDVYHDTAIRVDMDKMPGFPGGPHNTINNDHGFDIRVRWTGVEKVALRSVTLRDSVGELMLGNEQTSIDYRESIRAAAHKRREAVTEF